MIDNGARIDAHARDYAIIGSLSQVVSCDNRHCDIRKPRANSGMASRPPLRPEAAAIFARLDALGLKQRELAEAMGIEENKVSKVRAGERQFKAAEVLRGNDWLDDAEKSFGIRTVPTGQTIMVPGDGEIVQIQKLDLSLSMGPGTLIDDWVEAEIVSFDLNFIRSITRTAPERLKLVGGAGDSMYPTLQAGDVILIDTTTKQLSRQDGLYWINLYGAAGLKRLRAIGPGRVLVKSDNPTMDDQEVDASDLRIEGRAIWFAREL